MNNLLKINQFVSDFEHFHGFLPQENSIFTKKRIVAQIVELSTAYAGIIESRFLFQILISKKISNLSFLHLLELPLFANALCLVALGRLAASVLFNHLLVILFSSLLLKIKVFEKHLLNKKMNSKNRIWQSDNKDSHVLAYIPNLTYFEENFRTLGDVTKFTEIPR